MTPEKLITMQFSVIARKYPKLYDEMKFGCKHDVRMPEIALEAPENLKIALNPLIPLRSL